MKLTSFLRICLYLCPLPRKELAYCVPHVSRLVCWSVDYMMSDQYYGNFPWIVIYFILGLMIKRRPLFILRSKGQRSIYTGHKIMLSAQNLEPLLDRHHTRYEGRH
jgi:hypothetical protein